MGHRFPQIYTDNIHKYEDLNNLCLSVSKKGNSCNIELDIF